MSPSMHVAGPVEEARVRAAIVAQVTRRALGRVGSLGEARRLVQQLADRVGGFERAVGPGKIVHVDGRWRIRPQNPAWPSPAFDRWIDANLDELLSPSPTPGIRLAFLGVTDRCPFPCRHCSASAARGAPDRLGPAELRAIVGALQQAGATMLVLTGGEPMVRLDEVLDLVRATGPRTEVWINTSGLGVDREAAVALAQAGVAGLWISVDGEDATAHDAFRGWSGGFELARRAAAAAREGGLAVGLSLCPTRELIERGGLQPYAELAWAWGACAIRVTEPKAVGRWAGADVTLQPAHEDALAAWTDAVNGGPARRALPFVLADGVVSRRLGCRQAGRQAIYVAPDGQVHGCPFCLHAAGSLLDDGLDPALATLRSRGCSRFAVPAPARAAPAPP